MLPLRDYRGRLHAGGGEPPVRVSEANLEGSKIYFATRNPGPAKPRTGRRMSVPLEGVGEVRESRKARLGLRTARRAPQARTRDRRTSGAGG